MEISVVMAACNAGRMLQETIESIRHSLGFWEHEIVVINDSSTDGSCNHLTSHGKTVVFRPNHRLGCSGARSLGAKMATGDVIIIADPHCQFPVGALQSLAKVALESQAIVMPPILLEGKSVIHGAGLKVTNHGLILRRVHHRPEYPVLCGAIYAMSRHVYTEMGCLPPLPGWWGSWEIFHTILVYRLGLTIIVADVDTCTHRTYRPLKQLPYDLPNSHYALNAHWCYAVGLPVAYGSYFCKQLNSVGKTRLTNSDWKTTTFYDVQQWLSDCSVRSEDWFMENVAGVKPTSVEVAG